MHVPSLRGRVRADAGLLALTAVLLALAAGTAVVVPALVARDSDRTVAAALRTDAARSAVVVQVPLGESAAESSISAGNVSAAAAAQAASVQAAVPGLVGPPVAVLGVTRFTSVLASGEHGLTSLWLVHPWRAGATGVRWVAGGPAGASAGAPVTGTDPEPEAPPLKVGLAQPVAAALGVTAGDTLPAARGDGSRVPIEVVVSGVFTPDDASDPIWGAAPGLLTPASSGAGAQVATDVAALVDDEQVPDLVALPAALPVLSTTMPVRPGAVSAQDAERTAQLLAALEAAPPSQLPGLGGQGARLRTGADDVLRAATARVGHLHAQASVLLGALVATVAAVLIVAGGLLVQRRAPGLAVVRARGAPLAGTAAEAAVEAAAVAVLAVAGGTVAGAVLLATTGVVGDADVSAVVMSAMPLLAPLAVLSVAAPALMAVRVAAAPAAGRSILRSRGIAADAAVVLLAALAVGNLLQSSAGTGTSGHSGPLVAAVLPLAAVAVALLGRRAVVPLLAPLRGAAAARQGAVPLLAASRLGSAVSRAPTWVALVLACAGAAASVVMAAVLADGGGGDPRTAPADEGIEHLAVVSAAVMMVLGALAVVLDAMASSRARRTDNAATAVLGLPHSTRHAAAFGELMPSALVSCVLGITTGVLLGLLLMSRPG